MSIFDLTQSERAELAYSKPIYLVDWVLGGATLHLADQDFRYTYGASEILYESYLIGIQGIGEIIRDDSNPMNSNVVIEIANQRWSTYEYLSKLNQTEPFSRSALTVYEIRRLSSTESFSSDIRDVKGKYIVEQLLSYDKKSFKITCSSRIYNKRNSWGLQKITRDVYPYCAPGDVGQYRNIGYGSIENIPCRCVKTGAIDLLSDAISASATTITVQGLRRFEFEAGGSIQIGTEVITYTTFTAATHTFTGCTRTNGVPHYADEPVLQVVSSFVYEALKHQIRSISRVSVDDYDVTNISNIDGATKIMTYTGVTGYELTGYESKAMVAIPWTITNPLKKLINKEKDVHTHNVLSGTRYWPTTTRTGTDCANLRDWSMGTYMSGWGTDRIINFHDATYVENTYPVDYHTITVHMVFSKDTPVEAPINLYWIDKDPVTTSDLVRQRTVSSCKFYTIMPGDYSSPVWIHAEVPRTCQWRTGGIFYQYTGATDNLVKIYELFIEASAPKGRIPISGSGGSGTIANVWDGDDDTYVSLTQATASTRAIGLNVTTIDNRTYIKSLTVHVLLDSAGAATSWDIYALYGESSKVLDGTLPKGQVYAKNWYKFTFTCDTTAGFFTDWILSDNIAVAVGLTNGSGTTTVRIYDVYWVFDYEGIISPYEYTKTITADSIRGGLHTAQIVVGDELTIDAETRADDASGTITGTAGALITRPDHVLEHFLVNILGMPSGDIGSSFATAGTEYSTHSFEFAFLAHDISNDAQRLLAILAFQCRSIFYEWAGKFELKFLPDTTPSADFAIEDDDLITSNLPKFSEKPVWEVANDITCYFNRDYRSKKRVDNELYRTLDPDAASKGYKSAPLRSSYGAADIHQDLTLNAVISSTMAQDVLDFILSKKQTPQTLLELVLKWRAIQTAPGQCFSFTDDLMSSGTYRILEFKPLLEQGKIQVKGEKV